MSKTLALVLLAGICTAGLTACSANQSEAEAPQFAFDGVAEESFYIDSFDGTRIAITVYRPTINGEPASEPLPVVVTQDRTGSSIDRMQAFLDAGYVWIAQDRRGTGASFGVQTGFVNQLDARDAKAVIEWSAQQAFSSGKTVTMGCSNQGAWQYLVAPLQPESMVAAAPACASPMLFDDALALNGVPMADLADQPYSGECNRPPSGARPGNFTSPEPRRVDADIDGAMLAEAQEEQKCGAAMLGQYWLNMPRDGFNAFAGYAPALEDTAMTNWQEVQESGIAFLQMGGWYDAAVAGQIEAQHVWGGRLIMGPWVHGNRPGQGAELTNAEMDLTAETIRLFDHYTRGIENGADEEGITYYTLGAPAGEEWTTVAEWPDLPRQTFYLAAQSELSATTLDAQPASYAPQDVSWFDGRYSPLNRWYTDDLSEQDAKSLVHTSAPLETAMELTGAPRASLWVSADKPDANIYAMLEDVAPDGSSRYITDGRIRASWRKVDPLPWDGQIRLWHRGYQQDITPLVPGEPAQLEFDFFPISYIVPQGHRIRLALTTSIGEDYQQSPLAGGEAASIEVLRAGDRASSIALPLRPR